MKLRSLLSLEGVGLESNRSSALTEYGCEQVPIYLSHCASACKKGGSTVKHDNDIDVQEDVEVELRRELERLEVGSNNGGREGRPHITIQPTSSNNIHRC